MPLSTGTELMDEVNRRRQMTMVQGLREATDQFTPTPAERAGTRERAAEAAAAASPLSSGEAESTAGLLRDIHRMGGPEAFGPEVKDPEVYIKDTLGRMTRGDLPRVDKWHAALVAQTGATRPRVGAGGGGDSAELRVLKAIQAGTLAEITKRMQPYAVTNAAGLIMGYRDVPPEVEDAVGKLYDSMAVIRGKMAEASPQAGIVTGLRGAGVIPGATAAPAAPAAPAPTASAVPPPVTPPAPQAAPAAPAVPATMTPEQEAAEFMRRRSGAVR